MLQPRSTLGGRLALAGSRLRDDLAASDPGLLRLLLSLRGVLSTVLTTLAAIGAGHWWGFSPVECAAGITLGTMGPFLSSAEPTRRQRQRTLLALLPAAVAANALTAVLHGNGVLGDSLFLLLVFACFLLAPRSPRGIGIGLVAIVTTYVGLYLELPVATLPIQVAAQVAAVPIVAFACFVLVPVDPVRTLRRTVGAVQARAAQVIRHAGAAGGNLSDLRRDIVRLNQIALAADDQVGLLDTATAAAVRARLVDVELWTARLVDGLGASGAADPVRFGLHAHRIGRGRRYATQPEQWGGGTPLQALVGLGNAVHALGEAARGPAAAAAAPAPARPFVPGKLAWRVAARVTAGAALAMAAGMALSPQRWFWAVITVYVVFLNARSRGDTIYRGFQRLAGTLGGIVAGIGLATVLAGDTRVEVATLVVSVFGMYYFFLVSYATGIFFVTVLLGVLYALLGASPAALLVLRLEETAIGAAAAMLVAAFVLPARTRDQVQVSGRTVLTAMEGAVRASVAALRAPDGDAAPPPPPLAAMRPVDRALADLRLALAPLVAGRTLLRRSAPERRAATIVECVHWARMLAAESRSAAPGTRDALAADAAGIADRIGLLSRGEAPPGADTPVRSDAGTPAGRAVHGLAQAVSTLAERLEAGAYMGFAFRA